MPRRRLPDSADRRRRQNAEAQRTYRARQRGRVQALEQLVASALVGRDSSHHDPNPPAQLPLPLLAHSCTPGQFSSTSTASSINFTSHAITKSTSNTASSELYHAILPCSDDGHAKSYIIVARENFTIRDIVKYGLVSMGYAMDPILFQKALTMPPRLWFHLVQQSNRGVNMSQAMAAGIRILAQLNGPDEFPSFQWFQPTHPRELSNRITLSATSCAAAMIANAIRLGITPEQILHETAQSSLYGFDSSRGIDVTDIPSDLRPTKAQTTIQHHPCIDLIPLPHVRTKFILASTMDPPLVDEDDFALDLLGGGLRCWGSTMDSLAGRGQGVSWDSRSWEVMPWFQEKWAILMDGEDGDIAKTSAWWRAIQGVDATV